LKVSIINAHKEKFINFLNKSDFIENRFYFELISNWEENWNVEASNLSIVYDTSLQSSVSGRLWGGSTNSAKSMMILLLEKDEDFMRTTFRDLFKENLDLGLRLDRFGYHTDQVFNPIQSKNPKHISHYHSDREILCFYLAMEYPELYCLFDFTSFHKMMVAFESRNIPTKVEVERYYKSCRGIFNLLKKDEKMIEAMKKFDASPDHHLIWMSIFMEFVAQNVQ